MNRSEAIQILKRGLGFRQTQDAAIVAALKQAQRDLENGKTLPEWLVVYDAEFPVDIGDTTIPLPPRFLRLHEEYPLRYVNLDGGSVLVPRRHAMEANAAYAGERDPVYPEVMIVRGSDIVLVPTPTRAFTAYLTYYRGAEELDSDIENEWLKYAANYLIGLAGVHVAGDLRDAGAMQKFSTMAKSGAQAYLGDVVDTELMGRPLVLGRNN